MRPILMNIVLEGKPVSIPGSSRVKDAAALYAEGPQICGAFVGNLIKSLEYELSEGDEVRLLPITHEAGLRIYESTLILMACRSCEEVFAGAKLEMRYSIGGGLFCAFEGSRPMTGRDVEALSEEMGRLVSRALPVRKLKMTIPEARRLASGGRFANSAELLDYCIFPEISFYELDGYYGYFHSKTLSSTSQAGVFGLVTFDGGCVLMGPDPHDPSRVRKFVRQDNLQEEMKGYESWCEKLGVPDVISLNRRIEDNSITNLITIAETRHEQLITRMATEIYAMRDEKRVVLISGPSSAGKTTTSKRLRNHLAALGLSPIAVSLDDYFVDRERTPRDENGQLDFESIDAVDVDQFNADLLNLAEGNEVEIPRFDFITGKRAPQGVRRRVEPGSPIIIEGIHGLNDMLTPHIPRASKYKIYVNDLTHLNIDQANRIPTSDVRLLRRIVRDCTTRGHDAAATMAMWRSVKRGEEKNIYPFSGDADFVFNTSLLYEMSVLKKYAEPVLSAVGPDSVFYYEAQRLLDFLSFFLEIEDESAIYTNSILREFIGGNVFDRL